MAVGRRPIADAKANSLTSIKFFRRKLSSFNFFIILPQCRTFGDFTRPRGRRRAAPPPRPAPCPPWAPRAAEIAGRVPPPDACRATFGHSYSSFERCSTPVLSKTTIKEYVKNGSKSTKRFQVRQRDGPGCGICARGW